MKIMSLLMVFLIPFFYSCTKPMQEETPKLKSAVIDQNAFKMMGINLNTLVLNQVHNMSTTINPFNENTKIYGLDITSDITLNDNNSVIRFIEFLTSLILCKMPGDFGLKAITFCGPSQNFFC